MTQVPPAPAHRNIRSFVLRMGRMTDGQERALAELWPLMGLEFTSANPPSLAAMFPRHVRRVLEIGFGDGEHLAAMAASRPDEDFLGIEVHRPGVGHLLIAAKRAGVTNLRVLCHDAVEVLQQLPPDCLDETHLLFPDPWPKSRHHKRRLVQPPFVDLLARRTRPGGLVHMATDWEPYAVQMLEVLGASPLLQNTVATGGYAPDSARDPTRFERRGSRLGHAVHDLLFRRVI